MLIIHRQETDPYFNIAAEEYLLRNFREDIFTIWFDDPCVVVGKHQNTLAEINYPFVRENNIPVIRRITGGGTVYHDHGNLNYSQISGGDPGKLVDYRRSTQTVIQFLRTLGMNAEFQGKSNLVVGGKKISGNSAHVYRNRVIHHGTILFDADMNNLHKATHREKNFYLDKAVQSVRADVVNIREFLPGNWTIKKFASEFLDFFMNNHPGCSIYTLAEKEINEITDLANSKYRSWEWNFGYSPDYTIHQAFSSNGIDWVLDLKVSKGSITEFKIRDQKDDHVFDLGMIFAGCQHREENIRKLADNINFALDPSVLIHHIF